MINKNKKDINFGQIKSIYNEILAESISSKNKKNKDVFKKYVKTLKKNEILKTQFYIYSNIENKFDENKNRAIEFIKENISLMDKYSKEEIKGAIKKITNEFIIENENLYLVNDKTKELYENISKLILTKKNPKTIDTIVETTDKIADYITSNVKDINPILEGLEDIVISTKELGNLMISRFNETYSELSESEREVFDLIINSNEDKKEEVFKNAISECLSLVTKKLTSDEVRGEIDLRESLLNLKENLLNRVYNKENFDSEIIKVIELKKTLEN